MSNHFFNTTSSGYSNLNGAISTSEFTVPYYNHELTYNDIFDIVNDQNLPVIDDKSWEKISEMLDSTDKELITLGFKLLEEHRFPRSVVNLKIINKAINNFLRFND